MPDNALTPLPTPRRGHHPLQALAERIAGLFGMTLEDREATVVAMLDSTRSPAGYWLQLATAMGIATLGLILDSTAVVVGAMLVAPLMTPIISLGMGLAIGSPLLVIRSSVRVLASVVLVPLGAAAVTLVLPIRAITGEISSRSSPTVLDLAVACCCAVAGVYAATRPRSDRSSTAAGTAIGIALVPPLCVVGYGIGTESWEVARGAALLFTANLSAIVLLSVLGFAALGFAGVPVAGIERRHDEQPGRKTVVARVARRLSLVFKSKIGMTVRVAMPLVLVIVVYLPLRHALAQVTREFRIRAAVNEVLRDLPGGTVHSTVGFHGDDVSVRLVAIDHGESDTSALRGVLVERIAKAAPDARANIDIQTVPDARALARAGAPSGAAPPPPPPPPPAPDFAAVRAEIENVLASWPTEEAGPIAKWHLEVIPPGPDAGDARVAVVAVVHLGPPLGATAETMLARSLDRVAGMPVHVRDVALSATPIDAPATDGGDWLIRATDELSRAAGVPGLSACVQVPDAERSHALTAALRASPVFSSPHVHVDVGTAGWSLRWSKVACENERDAGADASDAGKRPLIPVDSLDHPDTSRSNETRQ